MTKQLYEYFIYLHKKQLSKHVLLKSTIMRDGKTPKGMQVEGRIDDPHLLTMNDEETCFQDFQ